MSCGGNPNRSTLKTVTCANDFDLLGVQNGERVQVPKSCIDSLGASVCVVDTDLIPENIKAGVSITSCGTTVIGTYTGEPTVVYPRYYEGGTAPTGAVNGDYWNDTGSSPIKSYKRIAGVRTLTGYGNLDSDLVAANVANGVQIYETNGTLTCVTPTVYPRFYEQNIAPASPVDGDYWNDTSTLDPIVSYKRVSGSWVQVGFGNLDADLTPGTVRDGTNIYGVLGTHQTTVSQVLNDAGTPDSQVFGIAGSLSMSSGVGTLAEATPYVASFGSKVAFIGMYKDGDAVIPMVQMLDTSTPTPTWLGFKRPQQYVNNAPGFSSAFSVKQSSNILKFIFSKFNSPNYSHYVLEFDMNTNTFQSTTALFSGQIGGGDLIQSISNSTVGGSYNLNLPPMDISPLFVNSDNDFTAPAVTGTIIGNTPVTLIGNNYFTKVSCFSLAHGAGYEASVAMLFAAAT